MELARLGITKKNAVLGVQTDKPPMTIQQPKADLQIRQQHTDTLEISTTAAKVNIDQSAAFADAGLIPPLQKASQYYQKANKTAYEYMSNQMKEAKSLKSVENGDGGKAIASLAKESSPLFKLETEFGYVPKHASRIKFKVQPGRIEFKAERAAPEIKVQKKDPKIDIPRWNVSYYMKQKPDIQFHLIGENVNRSI